ncbi:MAG TPA: MBL fold metallo-hydrolase [Verrucomicrobiae bacterium]|nr:MBL fold metallo-hydrolase [Verrucomicrobiae bacterium]
MQRSRRSFLKYSLAGSGVALAGASYWLSASPQRAARWLRRIVADSRRSILPAPVLPHPENWNDNAVTLSWIGHATVLINFFGVRILTDPALGNCVGIPLGLGTLGPKRYIASALSVKQLPPVDVLLISHAHMDHLDLPTLARFPKTTAAVSAWDTADLLNAAGLKHTTELAWGDKTVVKTARGELQIEAFQVKHWGQRWPNARERGYNGYILRREGKAILFGGDTAMTPLFSELRSRGPFDAAIMPIGAYDPWIRNHCNPEQAVELANAAGARYLVPVHHQTFRLSHEPMNEPIERFAAALQNEPERIALRQIGETFVCPS